MGTGTVELNLPGVSMIVLHDVRHVSELTWSLILVGQLNKACFRTNFSSGGWSIHKWNLLLARGPRIHFLYPLYVTLREGDVFVVDIPVSSLWHKRLRHLSKTGITHLSKANYIPKLSFSDHQFCEHCQYSKQVTTPHPTSVPRELSPLDLVHSDVCGPMPHQSLGGSSYLVTFIDDATRKVWAYPTRTKDHVFTIFKEWLAMFENQTDRKLKSIRSDNGGEYKSDEFVQFCRERGIRREFTAPHSPEQNDVAKRMNRKI
jgi:hypothetical protein